MITEPHDQLILHDDMVRSMFIINETPPPPPRPTPPGSLCTRHPLIDAIHAHEDRVHQGKTPD